MIKRNSRPRGNLNQSAVIATPAQLAVRALRRNPFAQVAATFIVLLIALAVFAPVIAAVTHVDPYQQQTDTGLGSDGSPVGPGALFPLGADQLGRDVLMRIIFGSQISLAVAGAATLGSLVVGTTLGMVAGFARGRVDTVLTWLIDTTLSMPQLLIALALVSVFGPGFGLTVAVIVLFSWASIARVIRSETISLREREFVAAARMIGSPPWRILVVDMMPNLLATTLVYGTLLIPQTIVFEATLSFLGLGVAPPVATWGNMLAAATAGQMYTIAWWMLVFPVCALVLTTLAFNVIGDAIRDAIDPSQQVRTLGLRRKASKRTFTGGGRET